MADSPNPTVPHGLNAIVKVLLRSPLHRVMSHNTLLLSFRGRKSGKPYTVAVSYRRDGEVVTCYTDSGWWKNLRGGMPVTVVMRGRQFRGVADVISDRTSAIAESLASHLRLVPRDARYHGVRLDAHGVPEPVDLQRAAQRTAMVRVRVTGSDL